MGPRAVSGEEKKKSCPFLDAHHGPPSPEPSHDTDYAGISSVYMYSYTQYVCKYAPIACMHVFT